MERRNASFTYPRLPRDVDAIRVLTIEPGSFSERLECTLDSVAFKDKPKYVALSYTWTSSYLDNAALPLAPHEYDLNTGQISTSIEINSRAFHVAHNLQLALLHLRSPEHRIQVWADAICINQADEEERNRQVSLMSFIYVRAMGVVAWLGTTDYTHYNPKFESMSRHWDDGRTQHLWEAIRQNHRTQSWPAPAYDTLKRIGESTYWKRLWIVQEICLPRVLFFVYGAQTWSYEEFEAATRSMAVQGSPMSRLIDTRKKRHSDMMTLESLIETYADNECSELRDKIFGLLGCANDIQASQIGAGESLEEHIQILSSGRETPYHPPRGMGVLKVEYRRSFYDIWTSLVHFIFYKAKSTVCNEIGVYGMSDTGEVVTVRGHDLRGHDLLCQKLLGQGRRISIVRIAGIVQKALRQKVDEECANICEPSEPSIPLIRAIGYIAGEIKSVGPAYTSLIGSFDAHQNWLSCWGDHYHEAEDLEILRRINEEYTTKIVEYTSSDLDRIRLIPNTCAVAHPVKTPNLESRLGDSKFSRYSLDFGVQSSNTEPKISLGTGCVIGLVPHEAEPGDVIVKFWNCDVSLLMRPIWSPPKDISGDIIFLLVGRADVAEVSNRQATPGSDVRAEQFLAGEKVSGFEESLQYPVPVFVDLDMRTLQRITAYSTA